MEHIYRINPGAAYIRNSRSRQSFRSSNRIDESTDNFSLKKLVAPIKQFSQFLDKKIPVAGKITNTLGADNRGLITRSPDVAKATVNALASPVTTLAGKTVFGAGQFDNKKAATSLNTTLKIAAPIADAVIAGTVLSSLKPETSKGVSNLLKSVSNLTPKSLQPAASNITTAQPVSTDPSTLPKTAASVDAEKALYLSGSTNVPASTIVSSWLTTDKMLIIGGGFVTLIVLILILKK